METVLILFLGLSSAVSVYYVLVGRKAYNFQLKIGAELEISMKEVVRLQDDLVKEHGKLVLLIKQMPSVTPRGPNIPEQDVNTDPKRKTWIN